MNSRAREILAEALRLPDRERAEPAAELIASLDPQADSGAARAWEEEIARRLAELDSGKVAPVPWSAARREILGDSDEPTGR
jgi:putative addiction module component (TIGR02574 family)